EFAGGRPVIQYRGEILPLISLGQVLKPGQIDSAFRLDPVQVVVFRVGDRSVGLAVDAIIDIATDAVQETGSEGTATVLRSTRIEKKVTDLLDLKALLATCGSELMPDLAQSLDALRSGVSQEWEPVEAAQ